MSDADTYRRKVDELLQQAAGEQDLRERSRLINLAVAWHAKAIEAELAAPPPKPKPET